jgi:hypothetical protein
MATLPFAPTYGSNQFNTATTSSQTFTIAKGDTSVRVCNTGAQTLYVRVGSTLKNPSGLTATNADCLVRAGSELIIRKDIDDNLLAYVTTTSTTACSVMTGNGGV